MLYPEVGEGKIFKGNPQGILDYLPKQVTEAKTNKQTDETAVSHIIAKQIVSAAYFLVGVKASGFPGTYLSGT